MLQILPEGTRYCVFVVQDNPRTLDHYAISIVLFELRQQSLIKADVLKDVVKNLKKV